MLRRQPAEAVKALVEELRAEDNKIKNEDEKQKQNEGSSN